MRLSSATVAALFVSLFFLAPQCYAAAQTPRHSKGGTEVPIPDANLEAALREALGKPTGPLFDTELATLTALNGSGRGIVNLSGLEFCTSLTNLDLAFNQISELGPLADLTNLTNLDLFFNQISELGPLADLTSLTNLDLSGNQISELGPLADLANLTSLNLSTNQISDLTPLADLTNLTNLDLFFNQISELGPLADLANLTYLNLDSNQISELGPLADLTNLTELYLDSNQISDLGPLADLTNLTNLNLAFNLLCDLGPLVENPSVYSLIFLSGNPLSVQACSSDIPELLGRGPTVTVGSSCDGGGLAVCPVAVSIPDPNLEAALREALNKPFGPLFDTELATLTALDGSGRGIVNLSGLEFCTSLDSLDLSFNQISDLAPLANLTSLTSLGLSFNQISDLGPLLNLSALLSLGLGSNQICDILTLIDNPASYLTIDLAGNPLSAVACGNDIGVLQLRGTEVGIGASCDGGGLVVCPGGEGEGEGVREGEGSACAVGPFHSADTSGNFIIELPELLRVIQFFNSTRFGCGAGVDGFAPNSTAENCCPHDSDFNTQNWRISLPELLRLIQFFNSGGYRLANGATSPDGYLPGLAP